MSLEYCGACNRNIDLDVDLEHEHFDSCFNKSEAQHKIHGIPLDREAFKRPIEDNISSGESTPTAGVVGLKNKSSELKTLKDLRGTYKAGCIDWWELRADGEDVKFEEIKQEAILWVKEDKKVLKLIHPTQYKVFAGLTNLWMKRLDITEEDLKWKN